MAVAGAEFNTVIELTLEHQVAIGALHQRDDGRGVGLTLDQVAFPMPRHWSTRLTAGLLCCWATRVEWSSQASRLWRSSRLMVEKGSGEQAGNSTQAEALGMTDLMSQKFNIPANNNFTIV